MKTFYYISSTLLILIPISLSSCSANMSKKNTLYAEPKNILPLKQIKENIINWESKGKISVETTKPANYYSCYFHFKKNQDSYTITLHSLFNLQQIIITINQDQQITSITKNGIPYHHIKNDDLIFINLLSSKLNNLIYWILGMPKPNQPYVLTKNDIGFSQDDLIIKFKNYHHNKSLAKKLSLNLIPKNIILSTPLNNKGQAFIIKFIITELKVP